MTWRATKASRGVMDLDLASYTQVVCIAITYTIGLEVVAEGGVADGRRGSHAQM